MSLQSIADFKAAIKAVLVASPAREKAAEDYAEAYYQYVKGHVFGANVKVADAVLKAKRDALKGTLATGMALAALPAIAPPGQFAGAWATGLSAFWAGNVATGATQNGTTGAPLTSPAPALSALFLVLINTHDTVAAGMAAALDTATRSVQATVTPPSGTVLGIS